MLQSGIRRHCTAEGWVPYSQKMPEAEVLTTTSLWHKKELSFAVLSLYLNTPCPLSLKL